MKILCFGAGAIGSYIAGSLALIGNPLIYVEQPQFIANLKENGVRIEDIDGQMHHLKRFDAYGSAEEAFARHDDIDLVITAVKGFNTDDVIKALKPFSDRIPAVLSLQNGVENEEKYAAAFGEDKVIPCSICTAISRGEQGAIKVAKLRGMGIADTHPVCEMLVRECCEAGLKAKLMPDGPAMKWSKMISNLLSNAASAIFNMSPAEVFADPVGFQLEIRQLKETMAVMKGLGISPVNIPGVPVKLLCWAVKYLPAFITKPILVKAVGGGRGSKMPSFYIDLHAGRKESEVEFLNGAVVRYGDSLGISTPVNHAYYEVLTKLASGELPLNSYERDPGKFLEEKVSPAER